MCLIDRLHKKRNFTYRLCRIMTSEELGNFIVNIFVSLYPIFLNRRDKLGTTFFQNNFPQYI